MSDAVLAIVMKLTLAMMADSEATLLFAGDAMMHQAQIDAAKVAPGKYDYNACFAAIAPVVSSADYAVVNLETPLGSSNFTGYPCFNAPVSYASALKDAGFDLFLTANNHTLDRRDRGLKYTVAALDSLQIPHIGTYVNQAQRDERLPFIAEIKGFKVGFVNYTYGTNGIAVQGDVVVDYIDSNRMASDVAELRKAGAEIIVAAMHWGEEYVLLPVRSERKIASELAALGVDVVIGGHPHVVQPIDWIEVPGKSVKMPVTYSLGNFISNMKTRDTRGGALAKVKLKRDAGGKAVVDTVFYELVFTVPPSRDNRNFVVYPIDSVPAQWRPAAAAFRNALNEIQLCY